MRAQHTLQGLGPVHMIPLAERSWQAGQLAFSYEHNENFNRKITTRQDHRQARRPAKRDHINRPLQLY